MSVNQIAKNFGVSYKTVLRDIMILEDVGIPVYKDQGYLDDAESENIAGSYTNFYKIDHHWLKRFM